MGVGELQVAFDIARYHRNGWAYAYFACAGTVALLVALVVSTRGGRASSATRASFGLNVGLIAVLLVAMGACVAADDVVQATSVTRLGIAAACFIGPSTLHFVCALVGWREQLRLARLVAWTAGVALAMLAVSTSWVIEGAWKTPFGFAGAAGFLMPFALLHLFACITAAFSVVIARMRITRDPLERRQLRAVLVSYAVGNLTFIDLLPLWGVVVLPTSFVWLTGSVVVLSYAFRQHRLLDIPDFGWGALAWALASSLIALPICGVLAALDRWDGWGRPLVSAGAVFALFVLFRIHLRRVQPRIDDFFLRQRRDLARELEVLSDKLLIHHTAKDVGAEVARVLASTLYVKLVAFALRDEGGAWRVVHSAWGSVPPPDDEDPLVKRFATTTEIVTRTPGSTERMFSRYGAEAIVPLAMHHTELDAVELLGLIAVGPRPDAHPFEAFELEFLARLRTAITGPLAAARLYDRRHRLRLELEAKVEARSADLARALQGLENAQSQLVHSEKMATLGVVVFGVASELQAAVDDVGRHVPVLAEAARAYDEAATSHLAAIAGTKDAEEILGWAKRVKLDFVRRDIKALVDAVAEGARRARGIAADLRHFARSEESSHQEVDLHRELDATLNLLRHDLKDRILVDRDFSPELPLVTCDRGPIGQVFMNLIINAIQAIDGPGSIRIRTSVIDDGARVEVAVRDDGKGIARENLDRIFEPFFTTKSLGAKGGTGLGLSISYGIVQRHGGKIVVDSALGSGTEFRVVLPVASSARLKAVDGGA